MEEKISIRPDVLETLTRIDMQMDAAISDGNDEELERLSKEHKQWFEYVNLTFQAFEKNGRYGVMLSDGRVVEAAIYDNIWMDDSNVIVLAKKGCEWIILYEYLTRINQHIICKELVPTNWASIYLALVNGQWGLYDSDKQEWLLEPEYDEIIDYASCFKIKKEDKYGLYTFDFMVPAIYDEIRICRGVGYVGFYKDGVIGYIDKNGEWTQDMKKANVWLESVIDLQDV